MLRDRIRNECTCHKLDIASIENKIRESIEMVGASTTKANTSVRRSVRITVNGERIHLGIPKFWDRGFSDVDATVLSSNTTSSINNMQLQQDFN